MKELNLRVRPSSSSGLFHDSRADSRIMIKCINTLVDKVNELVRYNNYLEQQIKDLKDKAS